MGLGAGVTVARQLDSQPTLQSPQSRSQDGTRSRGNCDSAVSQSTHSAEPTVTLSWPAGREYRSVARGIGAGETGTRLPANSPLCLSSRLHSRPRLPGVWSALLRSGVVRSSRAWTGETAAHRIASRLSPAGLRLATPTIMAIAVRSTAGCVANIAGTNRARA